MIARHHRVDGNIDVTQVVNVDSAKTRGLIAAANPKRSGTFRVQLVDENFDYVLWDTYDLAEGPVVGQVMFAGMAA